MIAYHVTPTENLSSILLEGLQPQIGSRSSASGEHHPAVYLFHSLEDCEQGLTGWLGEVLGDDVEICILKVNICGMRIHSCVQWEVWVEEPIRPECILAIMTEEEFHKLLTSSTRNAQLDR